MRDKCRWKISEDHEYEEHYETKCGDRFGFIDGQKRYEDFKFCPYCGKPIEEVKK